MIKYWKKCQIQFDTFNSKIGHAGFQILIVLLFFLVACQQDTEYNNDQLKSDFQNPPNSARPRVWWHWMNGNVTKEGIRKDLQWMQRVGIGGFQNFDANLSTPQVVEKSLVFMTPEWKDAFKLATNIADSSGLEMTIAGSPGWSETGGPWVAARDGMKKYVWTETILKGGQTFSGKLRQPKETTGYFQNVEQSSDALGGQVEEIPTYYNDALTIAFKLPPEEKNIKELHPKVSSSGGNFDVKFLTDNDLNTTRYLPPKKVGEEMWIQYEFTTPQTFKAMTVVGANHLPFEGFRGGALNRRLLVSNDGVEFNEVLKIPGSIASQNTMAFKATTGKYWRLAYETLSPPVNPFAQLSQGGSQEPQGVNVAEFVLYSTDRIDRFEDKASFTPWKEDTPSYMADNADAIAKSDVVDLTDKMQDDGTLNWDVPQGEWVVLRFGYSLTGRQNHPASPAGTGLEVDKLDEEAVRSYINTYLDMYKEATGGLMGERGLKYIILDSYEAGPMTWTHDFPSEFETRRGYSIDNWIPVLTGRIIESREASEKFLWDFRKTIGEMIAENHYDVIGQELNKRGMGRYTESHEGGRVYMADGMDVKRNAEVPMSAMWTPGSFGGGEDEEVRSKADIRESASVAHIYGKPFVAAESMTSINHAFSFSPEKLKRTADMEMASGLNRFVIHTSVHQPLDDKMPGFSLGPFGQYFTRQETWAEQARPWVDYLARSCYLLQQGQFVADALVYYGENSNITWDFREKLPKIPGYEFDFVNSTALMEVISAENGKLVTPSGGSYSVLFLDESAKEMTLPVLKKIKELVDAGVVVTGTKPKRTPSLSDDAEEFQQLVEEIWTRSNVYNKPADEVLKSQGIQEDTRITGNKEEILYVHRHTPEMEIYWLDNRSAEKNQAEVSFRVSGKVPELWHPETGKTKEVSWKIKDGRTIIPLNFESWEAYFIVFKEKTNETHFEIAKTTETTIDTLSGPWQVSFQPDRGAPEKATFESLTSWSDHSDPGIKYFSGTATYKKIFNLDNPKEENRIIINLGKVKNLAEVSVNGKDLGILWKTPFKIDITEAVKTGENEIEVKVTNLWVNRIIGDQQPGVSNPITFTVMPFYTADSPLLPSGLLGPITISGIK